jgi:NAD(P)H-hydrate repair Nnr-like enzyme with NAD(P)H-hydrate epimerase domain
MARQKFANRKITQKEWDQANNLSDELMTVMVGKGTLGGVGLVAVTLLVAKALLSLANNDKDAARSSFDNAVIPNVMTAIEAFEFEEIRYN